MIVTTYTCDKCGHSQTDSEQMWKIGVLVTPHTSAFTRSEYPSNEQLWCRSCIVKLGLLPTSEAINDPPQPDPPLTIEDMIREIVREELPCD